MQNAAAALEAEATRRAIHGVEVPVFHQGRECGVTVKHSDQLLMFLLRALLPERYGTPGTVRRAGGAQERIFSLEVDMDPAAGAGDEEAADGCAGDDAERASEDRPGGTSGSYAEGAGSRDG